MNRNTLLTAALLLLCVPTSSAAPAPKTPTSQPAAVEDLAGLGAGAMAVVRPEAAAEAWFLLDEDPRTGWTSMAGNFGKPIVIELADRSLIRSVQFDTANEKTSDQAGSCG